MKVFFPPTFEIILCVFRFHLHFNHFPRSGSCNFRELIIYHDPEKITRQTRRFVRKT